MDTPNISASAPNILLQGSAGAGKTTSLLSIPRAGQNLYVLCTEPSATDILLSSGISCEGTEELGALHWAYIPPADPDWTTLLKNADLVGSLSYEDLSKLKSMNKRGYRQYHELLSKCANYKCDRCGHEFGPVDELGPFEAVALDSLTGLNIMALDLSSGGKPARHQGEWGVAMDAEERLLNKLTGSVRCTFILTAHIERELDEAEQVTKTLPSALGRKLSPRLPRFFSEVIHCYRTQDGWRWSTVTQKMDLKARYMDYADDLPQDFRLVIGPWLEKLAHTSEPQVPERMRQHYMRTT